VGAAPASVYITFYVEVPTELVSGSYIPRLASLPIILKGTTVTSNSGISFNLVEDIDFSEKDAAGDYKAKVVLGDTTKSGVPSTHIMSVKSLCISGAVLEETFLISNVHKPFREITLANESVTDIMFVSDADGNVFHQVESLSQDTVFKGVLSLNDEKELVPMNLEVIPAPRRFVARHDVRTRLTTIRFGSGDARTMDDDIVPDPSELSLPLYGKTIFSRFSIDPNSLLKTQTLGLSPLDTTIRIQYRYGGGLSHNVPARSIRFVQKLKMEFRNGAGAVDAMRVRNSVDVRNDLAARGGDNPPTLSAMRAQIPAARQMQSRIVSKQDLLSRIYTMPAKFGRVYRAGIRPSPHNPLSTNLYVISRDLQGNLAVSPDSLKDNLVTYLNEFRLISDSIDILDAQVVNWGIKFSVLTLPSVNNQKVIQKAIQKLTRVMDIKNFQIDQPIVVDDITNIIINTTGVVSIIDLQVMPIIGLVQGRHYSQTGFDFLRGTKRGMIIPPPGSIFELKHPEFDIMGSAA
jgi:hypothetical protein